MNAVLSSEPPRGCPQHTGLGRGEGSRGVGVLPSEGLGAEGAGDRMIGQCAGRGHVLRSFLQLVLCGE